MDLRVTAQTTFSRTLTYTRQQTDRLAVVQQEAATGKRINSPSDDPLDAVKALAAHAQDDRLEAYLGNIRDARSELQLSNSAVLEVNQLLTAARQAGISGANSGNSQADFAALGEQVNSVLNRLVDVANTQHDGRYLFSGTAVATKPFALGTGPGGTQTVTYQGDTTASRVPISNQQTVDTLYVGRAVFQQGQGQPDVFDAVIALRDALKDTTGLGEGRVGLVAQRLGDLERVASGVQQTIGEQAANLENLDAMETRTQSNQLETRTLLGNIESADLTEVVVQMQAQQNLLQLTLASSAKLSDQSLLDFIR